MIARIWRGWTAHQNADAFETVLRTVSVPSILAQSIAGLREIQVLRLERLGETEFLCIKWFDDMTAARALAVARGVAEEDYDRSTISPRAREVLRRYDPKVEYYEVTEIVRRAGSGPLPAGSSNVIARVWRGWTPHQNADAFEAVLRDESIPNTLAKDVAGLREVRVLRLERLGETEFVTVLLFDDMDAVRALAVARGVSAEDYEKSIISHRARELLRRWDTKVEHYEIREITRH